VAIRRNRAEPPHGVLEEAGRPDAHDAALREAIVQFALRQQGDQPPGHEDGKAIRETLDIAQLVRREQHRSAFSGVALDNGVEGRKTVGIERGGRLVQEEDGGVRQHGHGQAEALRHAPRIGADRPARGAIERGKPQHLVGA